MVLRVFRIQIFRLRKLRKRWSDELEWMIRSLIYSQKCKQTLYSLLIFGQIRKVRLQIFRKRIWRKRKICIRNTRKTSIRNVSGSLGSIGYTWQSKDEIRLISKRTFRIWHKNWALVHSSSHKVDVIAVAMPAQPHSTRFALEQLWLGKAQVIKATDRWPNWNFFRVSPCK